MKQRIVAQVGLAPGEIATVSVEGRVVTLSIPTGEKAELALRCDPAHARRLAEAYLIAARLAEAGPA